MVVPNNHGVFLLKMIILGCEMGVPPFKETPIWKKPSNFTLTDLFLDGFFTHHLFPTFFSGSTYISHGEQLKNH